MTARPKKAFAKKSAKTEQDKEFEFFCDMDGVLDDFDTHARTEGKYDDKDKLNWNGLDLKWWSTIPAYQGAKAFFDNLRERGRTRMLTAPVMNSDCFRGKAEWVMKFRGSRFNLLDLIICRADDKELLARPNHILVDDRQKNIDGWVAAGGIGILHKGDYADTLKRVDEAMADYRAKKAAGLIVETAPKPSSPNHEVFIGTNGVLADFQRHLEAEGKIGADGKTKWDELDIGWWKTIPAFDGAKDFYNDVSKTGKVRFLTGPVPLPDSFEGSAEWTMKFRPEAKKFALLDVICCRSKDKMLLARPNHILIDDRQENIDAWTKAGGIGILHKGDFADTLKRLHEATAAPASSPPTKKSAAPKSP